MNNYIINITDHNRENELEDKITFALSRYVERILNKDGSVINKEVETTYFLENDIWNISFFGAIPQFKEQVQDYKYSNKSISFTFNNININKEIKFIVYTKLFLDTNESGVTKATLYNNLDIKDRISGLRLQQSKVPTPSQVKREMNDNNKDAIIACLKRRIKKLDQENKELKEQLKISYAEIYKQI